MNFIHLAINLFLSDLQTPAVENAGFDPDTRNDDLVGEHIDAPPLTRS
jgi:hypothetical protein